MRASPKASQAVKGKPLVEERRKFIFEWYIPNGIRHFYGHMLVWTRQYGEYPETTLPLWLFRYDRKTQSNRFAEIIAVNFRLQKRKRKRLKNFTASLSVIQRLLASFISA